EPSNASMTPAHAPITDTHGATAGEPGGIGIAPAALLSASIVSFGAAALFYGLRQYSFRNCAPDAADASRLVCATEADVQEASGNGRTYTVLTNVAFVVGSAALLAGAAWLATRLASSGHATARRAMLFVAPSTD